MLAVVRRMIPVVVSGALVAASGVAAPSAMAAPAGPDQTSSGQVSSRQVSNRQASAAAKVSVRQVTPTPRCRTRNLAVAQTSVEGAAGSVYVTFQFTNNGAADCSLRGYPGVVLYDSNGQRFTRAVELEPREVTRVNLAVGGTAEFFLRFPNPGVIDCRPSTTSVARVRPPGATARLFIALSTPLSVCRDTVRRSPVLSAI